MDSVYVELQYDDISFILLLDQCACVMRTVVKLCTFGVFSLGVILVSRTYSINILFNVFKNNINLCLPFCFQDLRFL